MDKWPVLGLVLVIIGAGVLFLLAGFIVTIILTLLKLIAVFVGIGLIVAGVVLIVSRRWLRARRVRWGPTLEST